DVTSSAGELRDIRPVSPAANAGPCVPSGPPGQADARPEGGGPGEKERASVHWFRLPAVLVTVAVMAWFAFYLL
ncbi:MAG: hypothetical protein AAGC55_09445, partial [Myxococcota bacterium]